MERDIIELTRRLEAVDSRCKSNTHRIDELKEEITAVNRLATAVEVMASKQNSMGESVERLETKVDALEGKPAKRWEGLVDKLIFTAAGAVLAWIIQGGPGL